VQTRNPTPYTDAWKERVRATLGERGRQAELARFLAGGDETRVKTRMVQIAKVLNQGAMPESEFVLAVEDWLAKNAKRRQTDGTDRKVPRRKRSYT
jgi:hypothetical protein